MKIQNLLIAVAACYGGYLLWKRARGLGAAPGSEPGYQPYQPLYRPTGGTKPSVILQTPITPVTPKPVAPKPVAPSVPEAPEVPAVALSRPTVQRQAYEQIYSPGEFNIDGTPIPAQGLRREFSRQASNVKAMKELKLVHGLAREIENQDKEALKELKEKWVPKEDEAYKKYWAAIDKGVRDRRAEEEAFTPVLDARDMFRHDLLSHRKKQMDKIGKMGPFGPLHLRTPEGRHAREALFNKYFHETRAIEALIPYERQPGVGIQLNMSRAQVQKFLRPSYVSSASLRNTIQHLERLPWEKSYERHDIESGAGKALRMQQEIE